MRRILIIEDEAALREVYVILFTMNKYEVYEAANGKIAADTIAAIKPDVIILDALMPVMGGIEFLKAVNIKNNFPNTKVLMLSNLSDPKTISLSHKLGAQKYLLKASASPEQLVEAVRSLFEPED